MDTVRKFTHKGQCFEIKIAFQNNEWHLKVFVNGKPFQVDGFVSDEAQQDAAHQSIFDPKQELANVIEGEIKKL